jgi:zinc transport system ATP-binding protein
MQKVDHKKNIIELRQVSFAYNDEQPALNKIDFVVHQGDYLGLVGPNGAGKTTLLKIILHQLKADSGQVFLFGQPIEKFKDWKKISYVPQQATNFDLNFPATVWEVVAMGRFSSIGLFKRLGKPDNKIIDDALRQVDLWDLRQRLIGDLSGGQKQRVFIARALAAQAEVIFLDEPTTGVDQSSQDEFYKFLKKLNAKLGLTLILITHDIERIVQEAMHIACLDKTLVCHDSPQKFLTNTHSTKLLGHEMKILPHRH